MTFIDWIVLIVVVLSVVLAAAQGFFFEIFSLAGVVLGFLLAAWEYARLAPWFSQYVKSEPIANTAAFLTIFFGCVLIAGVAGRITRWAAHGAGLKTMDRVLGGVFGLLRGFAMVTAAIMALAAFTPESQVLAQSEFSGYFLLAARTVAYVAPTELRQRVREGVISLRNAQPELAGAVKGKSPAGKPLRAPGR